MELFILVIIYFTRIEYYHMTLVRVFLTVEAQYFLSEKGQRIHRMSATCFIYQPFNRKTDSRLKFPDPENL
jgi:hypothetical protein